MPGITTLALAGRDHVIRVYDTASPAAFRRCAGHRGEVVALALSPDGKTLASAGNDNVIRLWDAATGQERASWAEPQSCNALAFSPDGKALASGGAGQNTKVWEVASGRERCQCTGANNMAGAIGFSPDGTALALAGADQAVRVWDLRVSVPSAADLSDKEIEGLWTDLAAADASQAYRALCRLMSAKAAIPLFQARIRKDRIVMRPADPARIPKLVSDLDDDRAAVREQAAEQLAALGKTAEPALRQALESRHSAEVGMRVRLLLEQLHGSTGSPAWLAPDSLRRLRVVEVLERLATPEAKQMLQALAADRPEAALAREARAAVDRLTRRLATVEGGS
jgi:hypothetical protein